MKAIKDSFRYAEKLHKNGSFQEAETVYLRLLGQNPADASCLHNLGLLHAETGRTDTALQLLRVAITIDGPLPHLCRNLGIILERQGRRLDAIACYRQVLESKPEDVAVWRALALLLSEEGRHQDAARAWRRAFESRPSTEVVADPMCLTWANSLALSGEQKTAIALYDQILAKDPENIEAAYHRAVALMQIDDAAKAIEGFLHTLSLAGSHAEASNNLGILLQIEHRYGEAIRHYQKAISDNPNFTPAIYNLGTAWQESAHPRHAVAVLRKFLKREPSHAGGWTNLGNARLGCNEIGQAIECYQRTLELSPHETAAEWNLGIVHLLSGDLTQGWRGYEKRFDVKGATPRREVRSPLWQGQPLADKSLLLHAEQGLGDTLQFIRYAPMFADQGATVIVECQAELGELVKNLPSVSQWIPAPKPLAGGTCPTPVEHLPITDFQLPFLSAPAAVGTTLATIPLAKGYLTASDGAVEKWRRWLGPPAGTMRVGLCWAGNPNHKNDHNRSLQAELLNELSLVEGVEWISLQKGRGQSVPVDLQVSTPTLGDFADTAGLITNLDLVISVDTAVAHLAGALGRPVWILLPFAPDWRWLLDRSDSPWYSSARLFRQKEIRKWRPVLRSIAEAATILSTGR